MRRLMPAILLAISVVGCATYRTPRGDDIATLRGTARNLGITSVDGEPTSSMIEFEGVGEVRLSPGKHIILVVAFLGGYYAQGELWFVAASRGSYELHCHRKETRVAFWITDTSTGLPVGGVKGSDDEPPDSADKQPNDQGSPIRHPKEV